MSPFAWVLALAATLVSGGVGLASAAVVASLTKAPRLRYVACAAALAFALTPLLMGFGFTGDHQPPPLMPINLVRSVTSWVTSAQSPSWLWMLARSAPALLTVYAVGVAACVARLSWRWLALRRVLLEAQVPDPARLKGVASPLPIRVTEQAPSPLLIGVRHPVAVLPARALEHMTGAQLHWVLAHEEAHARRGDNLRLLAEGLLRAVLWFNPFVACAAVLAAEAREQLCDQSVLSAADAAQRRAYADTLLLALRLGSQSQVASTLIHSRKRSLSMRLKVIMSPAQPTPGKAAASFVAIAAAGLFTCAVGAAAWAQTPPSAQGPAQAPVDIKSD
jgi:beta-lactamase regulating signal transducer with metallopeptidase domain